MTTTIDITLAEQDLAAFLDVAKAGNEVVITKPTTSAMAHLGLSGLAKGDSAFSSGTAPARRGSRYCTSRQP